MTPDQQTQLNALETQLRAAQAANDQAKITDLTAQIAAFKAAHP